MSAPEATCPGLETRVAAVPAPIEEVLWVASARKGDPEATLRLLARHRPPLVRLLAGMLGDWAAAEDLAQEVFLNAFRSLGQLRDPAQFYPWVRRSAIRLAGRRLRARREVSLEAGSSPATWADPARDVEQRLALNAVLAELSPELRITLLLREVEGLEYGEIAEALGVPIGTVRSRLFAAREQFRKHWSAAEAE